jgi:serine/threonine protein kinase
MGQVYKARDTRLNRTVAIKVLPPEFASRPDWKQRFEREAQTIASLNHPHICTLHDVGQQDGIDYLVMEFLEGQTLAQRLERGALPLDEALKIATEVADALDKAHRQGIVHRDLKPANVMLTKGGVKLLDFGLAKPTAQSVPFQNSNVPTAGPPANVTAEGTILGSLQYMSPEQLQGKEADARSDLFSFGCVLYEMLTGKQAFEGQSAASVIAAILEREPAPLNLSVPLERVIRACLVKDPDGRFQNALDLKTALTWAFEQWSIPAEPRSRRWWIAAAAAVVVLGALGFWQMSLWRNPLADKHVIRFQLQPPEGGRFVPAGAFGGGFAVSPDSQSVAFITTFAGSTWYMGSVAGRHTSPFPCGDQWRHRPVLVTG